MNWFLIVGGVCLVGWYLLARSETRARRRDRDEVLAMFEEHSRGAGD